jgi:hypothetical protein
MVYLLVLSLLFAPACLFRKKKAPEVSKYPAAPIRCAPLPFNIPPDHSDLRWVSFGAPTVMARLLEEAPDLEAVALWESIPVALESVGETRTITPENAAYLATRLTARWAIQGELLPARRGMRLRIDFVPARASQVAYRYEGPFSPESMVQRMREALQQFLEYLIVRPLPRKTQEGGLGELKQIAQALEQEYGWYGTANPGKAEKVVAQLAASHMGLARILFNPTLYAILRVPATDADKTAKPPSR